MRLLFCTMAIAALAIAPAAADSLEARTRACRAESDSLKRLRCYDELPLSAEVKPVTGWGAKLAAPAAPLAAAAPQPAERFGLPATSPAPAPAPVPSAIDSEIEGRFLGWAPGQQLKLRNGQVWEISDDSSAAYDLMQPKVRIEKGRFGGFFLRVAGVEQMPRVRRLK